MRRFITCTLLVMTVMAVAQKKKVVDQCIVSYNQNDIADKTVDHLNKEFEIWMEKKLREADNNPTLNSTSIRIPVIFHIIHQGNNSDLYLSKSQIYSQLRASNEDFNRLNHDSIHTRPIFQPVAGKIPLKLVPATVDPDGVPLEEPGINRVRKQYEYYTSAPSSILESSPSQQVKLLMEEIHWPVDEYLNVYIADFDVNGLSQFPRTWLPGLPHKDLPDFTNGILLDYKVVGTNYNSDGSPSFIVFDLDPIHERGRIFTHEIAHWLGVRHIWGESTWDGCDSDDYCSDTPNQESSSPGVDCEVLFAQNTCIDEVDDQPDMTENYMDYGDDRCKNLFTQDQINRMKIVLSSSQNRIRVAKSDKADPVNQDHIFASFEMDQHTICPGDFVNFTNKSITGLNASPIYSYQWNFDSDLLGAIPTFFDGINPPPVQFNSPGLYFVSLQIQSLGQIDKIVKVVRVLDPYEDHSKTFSFESSYDGWSTVATRFLRTNLAAYDGGYSIMLNQNTNALALSKAEYFVSEPFDFSDVSLDENLSFQFAYAHEGNSEDPASASFARISLEYSIDCNDSYTEIWAEKGETAATTVEIASTSNFIPFSTDEWRVVSVSLSELIGNENVRFAFVVHPTSENNGQCNILYLDNISIDSSPSTLEKSQLSKETSQLLIEPYPNPISDSKELTIAGLPESAEIQIISLDGKLLVKEVTTSRNPKINLSGLKEGIYLLKAMTEGQVSTHRIRVAK